MRRTVLLGIVMSILCVGFAGCSEERRVRSDIEDAFEGGDYRETIALCRLASRKSVEGSFVYYYWGASLLALNRDFEAFSRFDDAARRSPEDRRRAGRLLADEGMSDIKGGNRSRASRRLRKAQELDPTIDYGPVVFLVADECFAEKDFKRAAVLYTKAVGAYPDTAACQSAFFNLSLSRVALGDSARAMKALESLLDRYPRGELNKEATFRLEAMLFAQAQKEHQSGNDEEAMTAVKNLIERTRNTGLTQKSHYLLGEIHEALGDYGEAYRAYREVIRRDLGASGRIVQRAREKMDAISEAGLR